MSLLDARGRERPVRPVLAWNGHLVTLLSLAAAILAGLVLTWTPPLAGTALVGMLAIVIGTLIEPLAGLAAALFLGPLKAYLSAEVPQIPPQAGHAFVALALTSWVMRSLSTRNVRLGDLKSPLSLALLGFFGAVLLSLWDAAGLAAHGVPELIKWAEMLLLFFFVREHLATPAASQAPSGAWARPGRANRRLRWLVVTLLGAGIVQALIGIWQFGLRGEGPDHFAILGGDFFRAYGTFEQPNPYAGYIGLTSALALGLVLETTKDRWLRWYGRIRGSGDVAKRPCNPTGLVLYILSGGAAGAMLVALVASWSRGAWIGFGAASLVMVAALPRKIVWSVLLVGLLVIGSAGLYASGRIPASLSARLISFVRDLRLEDVRGVAINDANYAVIERLAHWQAALTMLRHNLWTGVGFGCYEAAYPTFALTNWPLALGHAHNIYLNMAAETGLVGLVSYLIFWVVLFWQTWRLTRRASGLERGLSIGLLGAWTHVSVHHLLDNLYVNNVHLHTGVLFGLTAYLVERANRTASGDDR